MAILKNNLQNAAAIFLLVSLSSLSPRADETPAVADKLSRAIRIETISNQDRALNDQAKFAAFRDFLVNAYPLVHANMSREIVSEMSLIYTWKGTNDSLKPLIYAAHQDVVPIAPGTEKDWEHAPFSGDIAGGMVWGRGAIDDKHSLVALLEAAESLLAEGWKPKRTIYFAFGHDEEVGGDEGAVKMAELFRSRGIRAEYVLDEGGMIVDGSVMGLERPIAAVGIAEKGYLSLELKVRTKGGHSSMPPAHSAIGILAVAVAKIEDHPFPARLSGVAVQTLDALAPELPPPLSTAVKNRWLFGPLIVKELLKNDVSAALVRTTTAVTIIEAGTKENVLPQEARAVVNFRLLPGDSADYVTARIKEIIGDDRIEISIIGTPREASPVTDVNSWGYQKLTSLINSEFPDAVVAPLLVLGGSDSRHYSIVSGCILRFMPLYMKEGDQEKAHGTNENIEISGLEGMVRFYQKLLKESNSAEGEKGNKEGLLP